jgi:hypothetical protein
MPDTKIKSSPRYQTACGTQQSGRHVALFAVKPDFPVIGLDGHDPYLIADLVPRPRNIASC